MTQQTDIEIRAAESLEDTARRAAVDTPQVAAAQSIPQRPSGFPVRPATRRYSAAWIADCLEYVEQECAKGVSLYEVGSSLRVPDSTLDAWFARAGKAPPRLPRRRNWQEIIPQIQAMRRDGATMLQCAAALNLDPKRIYTVMKNEHISPRARPRVHERAPNRRCLRCDTPFVSEGAHNRMCNPCRNYSGTLDSPYCPDPGGSTGRQMQARRA